jgi:hypothetical protein
MQSNYALRMMPVITEWFVGPALVAGPRLNQEMVRRRAATLQPAA